MVLIMEVDKSGRSDPDAAKQHTSVTQSKYELFSQIPEEGNNNIK